MRVHNLLAGLLSLAGLAIAAPTPQSSAIQLVPDVSQPTIESNLVPGAAPQCSTLDPKKWLIHVCGRHVITNLLGVNLLNHCTALSRAVAHEVTDTSQSDGIICYFYDGSNHCNSEYMIATVTRHTDIPAPFGKRAEFVMCRRRQMGDAAEIEARGEDDSSSDLDSFVQPDESRALVSPFSNCITPDSRNHFLNICTEDSYGNAFPNRWIDTCVQLSPNVAHHVTIIVQKAGLMCKFYDDSNGCSGNVRYITRTIDKPHRFEPPAEFGNDLKYALCRRGEWKRDADELKLETHDEDVTLDTTTDQSTGADTNEVTTSTKTQYLLARISSDITSIELKENSMYICTKLSDRVGRRVTHTTQHNFAACQFFASNCDGAPLLTLKPNMFGSLDQAISSDIGSQITHVKCGIWNMPDETEMPHGSVDMYARDEDAFAAAAADIIYATDPDTADDSAVTDVVYATHMYADTRVSSIEESALGQCYRLPDETIKQVTWIEQPQGYVCDYYQRDCQDGNVLRTLDTRKAKWSYPTEPEVGMQIEYAMCKPSFDKRDGPVMSEGPVVNSPLSVVASSLVTLDSQVPKLPALEWGQLRIGEDLGNTHIRKVVSALNGCVDFPTPMYPNSIHLLEQSGRSECLFYSNSACPGAPVLHTLNPEEKDLKQPTKLAQQINSAQCAVLESLEIPPTSIQTRSELLPQVKANDIQVTVGHSVSALSTSSLKVADLYICNEANLDPAHCTILHTLNQCIAFPGPFAYQTKVITQAKGSLCKYYTKPGCMDGDLYFSYMSNPTQDARLSGWGVEKLAGVWCGGTGATSTADVSAVNTHISIDSSSVVPFDLAKRGNPFYRWSTSPGSTSICRQRNFAFCTNNAVNALHQCVSFAPADQGPASMIQYAGVYCKWYADSGCASGEHKPYDFLDSRKGDAYADGLSRLYRSVKCEKDAW
ncbi:hypothetical protein AA0117_g6322 [Alternaria alternata]|jgi:hypothetical protein|uniref:Ig-like domain-containing protein n=1 Tax=Alternaria alternata TaxID=5599 RepID=A0A4Q4NGZ3_ALTAL|nr:hypothetical protein AA0117_g6322 [Alternaria alternata]